MDAASSAARRPPTRMATDKSSKRRVFASHDDGRRGSDASAASRRNEAIVGGPRRASASSESEGFDERFDDDDAAVILAFAVAVAVVVAAAREREPPPPVAEDEATRLAGAPSPPLTAPTRSARSAADRAADARAASALSARRSVAAPTSRPPDPDPDPYPYDPRPDACPDPPRVSAGVVGADSPAPARSRVRVVRIVAGRRPPTAVAARCSAATPSSVGDSRPSSSCAPLADSCAMSRRVPASMRRVNGSAFSGHRDAYAEKSARAPDRTSGDPSATMERIADSTASWLRAPPRLSHSRTTRRSQPVAWHRSFTLLSLLAASHSLGMRCLA